MLKSKFFFTCHFTVMLFPFKNCLSFQLWLLSTNLLVPAGKLLFVLATDIGQIRPQMTPQNVVPPPNYPSLWPFQDGLPCCDLSSATPPVRLECSSTV
jgi:hypothetical protein